MRKTGCRFLLNGQVRLFQRWKLPNFSLIWCFDFLGYPENMPSLQPYQNALCEVHLKVSTEEEKPQNQAPLYILFPVITVSCLFS